MRSKYIVLRNIVKRYYDGDIEILALKNVSLEVDRGDSICIVGPNGSGKTTLLKIIGGYLRPDEGEVYVDNIKINELRNKELVEFRKKYIGFIFQEEALMETLSVYENLDLAAIPIEKNKVRRRELVNRLIREWNLMSLKDRLYGKLSTGEKRIISIVKALINRPEIIIADEPTSNLDMKNTEKIIELLKLLNKNGKTILTATHDIYLVKEFRKQVTIRDGEIIEKR